MGRPPKPFEEKHFEYLCKIQCSTYEIAAFFEMKPQSLHDKVAKIYGEPYMEVYKRFSAQGIMSIRRKMYQRAVEDGSDKMIIWATKQYLGMTDKVISIEAQLQKPMIIEKLTGEREVLAATSPDEEPVKTKYISPSIYKKVTEAQGEEDVSIRDSGSGEQLPDVPGLSPIDKDS